MTSMKLVNKTYILKVNLKVVIRKANFYKFSKYINLI